MRGLWDAVAGALMTVMGAIPLWGVKLLVLGMLGALAAWAMTMPAAYAFKGAPDQARWRDVRVWAVIVIVLEMIPYIVF